MSRSRETRGPIVRSAVPARRFALFEKEAATPIIDSEEVDGGYGIWLHEAAPGASPPRHIHHWEDEIFYILQGRLLLWCDGQTYQAGEGNTVVLPKGVPYTWLVTGAIPAKLLAIAIPGGLMRFFDAHANAGPNDESLSAAQSMAEFGLEFVGPPLLSIA